MDLTVEQGWRKGDLNFLCKNLCPLDKKECRFHTQHVKSHIAQLVHDMGDHLVSVHDEFGRLWWLGGLVPANDPKYPNGCFAWLLKTTYAKPKRKAERAVMRQALRDVIELARSGTDYDRMANIIWDQQKTNLRWLESEDFIINKAGPLRLIKPNGEMGIFYQFCKMLK